MRLVVLLAFFSMAPLSAQQAAQRPPAAPADQLAGAYEQFLLAHRLEQQNDIEGAIGAYKRAINLDPASADVPAELASLLLRQSRSQEAKAAAEQSLAIDPRNSEANRVLGTIYAAMADASRESATGRNTEAINDNIAKAIRYLEAAVDRPIGQVNSNTLATLARLYVGSGAFDKAIPLLTDLVSREPDWQEGTALLVNAYVGAGRDADAISWLEPQAQEEPRLLPLLADLYERTQRWRDAARAYEGAVERTPRNFDLKTRYASVLMTLGGHDDLLKARSVLQDVVAARAMDARSIYLLSQSQRRLGDDVGAEATARRLITLQNGVSPWGYHALSEALEDRGDYKAVVDAVAPQIAVARQGQGDPAQLRILLPHLGFAYQQLGDYEKAIAAFSEAQRVAPDDALIAGGLVEVNMSARRFAAAAEAARRARGSRPDDLRLVQLEAQALRQDGRVDEGIALLERSMQGHVNEPQAYIALAQQYVDSARGSQAIQLLKDAEAKFPADTSILFELGSVLERQKNFAGAEAAFRQVIAKQPDHAAALNYLGYMLADRGERLDESVILVKRALEVEPNNGSFLDSLGWAYYKADKLDLAEANLRRAATQLRTNSVIQDHFGAVLFKLGRYDEAIAAWTAALAGDGETIDRAEIDRKIRTAQQKLPKK
jgi:tetratricopeptide (TPR) repeat protein